MRWVLMLMALMIAMPAVAQIEDDPNGAVDVGTRISTTPEYQIRTAMLDSAEGWNRGDVDRFLAIYSDDPATSFTGSDLARGKAGIRARYLAKYTDQFGGGSGALRSQLNFTFEDFRMIGADHALLIARWSLVKPGDAAATLTGMTSLLFRREPAGWRIIADHSS